MTLTLSAEQERARNAILSWYRSSDRKPFFLLEGAAGTGKQQPVDCIVHTPKGPRQIGSIKVGDYVFGSAGDPVLVTGVYPQGVHQAYKFTVRCGFSTECGADHLWTIRTPKRVWRTVDTNWLLGRSLHAGGVMKFRVPLCSPVKYSKKDLPLAPYFLGALIGDGTDLGKTPILCCPDYEIRDMCATLCPEAKVSTNLQSTVARHRFSTIPFGINSEGINPKRNKLGVKFEKLGLDVKSPDRFIPRIYMESSIEDRIELLRGLMDTDGSCHDNRVSFSTKSNSLLKDICELVQSLGGIAVPKTYHRVREGRSDSIEHHVNIKTFFNPFHLWRKANGWKLSTKNPPSRSIVSIEPSRMCEQVCIQVDSPDGLYLTDHFIVTHNTSVITATTDCIDGKVVYAAPTGRAALVMRKKGCNHAMTLHSLLYTPKGMGGNRKQVELLRDLQSGKDVKAQLLPMLQAELVVLEAQFEVDKKNNSNFREPGRIKSIKDALKSGLTQLGDLVSASPLFQLNPDSALRDADLLVIDESSMVPEAVLQDALSFGVPILLQGDRNQLAPVKSTSPLLTVTPDFSLQEIHRQAKDSPIIYLTTLARHGKPLPVGYHGNCLVTRESSDEEAMAADQIIVGTHKRRWAVNERVRQLMGYTGIYPNIGERVICRSNDHKVGLLNGDQFKVTFFKEGKYSSRIGVTNEELTTIQSCHNDYFHKKEPNPYTKKSAQCFDYGFSITCHSSQGGQFPSVYVVDESHKFGAERNRWLYTATSRASDKLVVRL